LTAEGHKHALATIPISLTRTLYNVAASSFAGQARLTGLNQ